MFAGTLNGTGALRVRVDRAAADSVVARIVAMVEQASATKARPSCSSRRSSSATRSAWSPPPWRCSSSRSRSARRSQPTLLRAMTFMIVASPCAVVLATMPPLLSAIANAGRHGVLVKSAVVMEQLGRSPIVAFDKTGTLTEGRPGLPTSRPARRRTRRRRAARAWPPPPNIPASIRWPRRRRRRPRPPAHPAHAADDFDSAPAAASPPPSTARRRGRPPALLRLQPATRRGPRSGRTTASPNWKTPGGPRSSSSSTTYPVGVLGLADQLRPDAAATVAALTALTGTTPVLLTGDNHRAAPAGRPRSASTTSAPACCPQDKVTAVRALQATGHRVLLVGDGVNDAPALAAAAPGIAMGRHGSDLALETADAVIVRDELATIPTVIALSRRARRVVIANLAIAATFITVLVLWDLIPPRLELGSQDCSRPPSSGLTEPNLGRMFGIKPSRCSSIKSPLQPASPRHSYRRRGHFPLSQWGPLTLTQPESSGSTSRHARSRGCSRARDVLGNGGAICCVMANRGHRLPLAERLSVSSSVG